MLKPLDGLSFYPEPHRYRYKGKWLSHSVTGVIGHDMSQAKRAAINFYKEGPKGWAARGTALHLVLENLLTGNEIKEDEPWENWILPLQECELFEDSETIAVEYALCDPKKSLGGSFDFLIKTKQGENILGDLKTCSSKRAAQTREPANEQLGAYALMMEKHHPRIKIDKCCTLVLGPHIANVHTAKTDKCVEAWRDKWDIFQLTQEEW